MFSLLTSRVLKGIIYTDICYLTKIDASLGDEKWLKKNPVLFDTTSSSALWDFTVKLFKRAVKIKLAQYGITSFWCTKSYDNLKVSFLHEAVAAAIYMEHGEPRTEELVRLRSEIYALTPRLNMHTSGTGDIHLRKVTFALPLSYHYDYNIRRDLTGGIGDIPLHRAESVAQFFKNIFTVFDDLILFHTKEMELYTAALAYIKGTKNLPLVPVPPCFNKCVDVEKMDSVVRRMNDVYTNMEAKIVETGTRV